MEMVCGLRCGCGGGANFDKSCVPANIDANRNADSHRVAVRELSERTSETMREQNGNRPIGGWSLAVLVGWSLMVAAIVGYGAWWLADSLGWF